MQLARRRRRRRSMTPPTYTHTHCFLNVKRTALGGGGGVRGNVHSYTHAAAVDL